MAVTQLAAARHGRRMALRCSGALCCARHAPQGAATAAAPAPPSAASSAAPAAPRTSAWMIMKPKTLMDLVSCSLMSLAISSFSTNTSSSVILGTAGRREVARREVGAVGRGDRLALARGSGQRWRRAASAAGPRRRLGRSRRARLAAGTQRQRCCARQQQQSARCRSGSVSSRRCRAPVERTVSKT